MYTYVYMNQGESFYGGESARKDRCWDQQVMSADFSPPKGLERPLTSFSELELEPFRTQSAPKSDLPDVRFEIWLIRRHKFGELVPSY